MQLNKIQEKKFYQETIGHGFTLVEVLIASALLTTLAVGLYQAIGSLQLLTQSSRLKAQAVALANEQIEIARNLPYSDVGIIDSWPAGLIPREQSLRRGNTNFVVTTTVRNIDDPFDGQIGGNPNDLNPADYKLVEVGVDCPGCHYFEAISLATFVAPKNLETSSGNGALFVRVIDSNGQPVVGVSVRTENLLATSSLVINDETNQEGLLALVDLPPAISAYRLVVSKNGYSSARTYALGEAGIANPINPDATVLAGQLTQVTLTIDPISQLKVEAINEFCVPQGPFSFNLKGTKTIDKEGLVPLYDQTLSIPALGNLTLSSLYADTYSLSPINDGLVLLGSFPLQSVYVPAGAEALVKLLLGVRSPAGLLVSVRDGVSSLPLSGALVSLSKESWSQTLYTSRGFFRDTDWSSGDYETDGNIEVNSPAGEIKLKQQEGEYSPSGQLVSTILDAGTASTTFYQISWLPWDQSTSTGADSVQFQLAGSDDPATSTWDFVGPDGTNASYYTKINNNISSVINNHRYLRYKVFLQTADASATPNLTEIAITYSSECLPFGQIFFSDLGFGVYNMSVSADGYQTYQGEVNINSNWQLSDVVLNPES